MTANAEFGTGDMDAADLVGQRANHRSATALRLRSVINDLLSDWWDGVPDSLLQGWRAQLETVQDEMDALPSTDGSEGS